MKVVGSMAEFPDSGGALTGLGGEAFKLLQSATRDKPVLVIDPEGTNVAALKRAFQIAAKVQGKAVLTKNGDRGTVLVALSVAKLADGVGRAVIAHPDDAVEAEARRLYLASGNPEADYVKLSTDAKRKLVTSAKRNLSRIANR